MKRALLFSVVLLVATSSFAAETQRYVVAMRHLPARLSFRTLDGDIAPRNVELFRHVDSFAVDLTAEEAADLRSELGVVAVELVKERRLLDVTPAVPPELISGRDPNGQTTPYGVSLVDSQQVWPVAKGDGINVVILDTGIDYNHPDLKDDYAGGYNTFKKNNDPLDDNGHGTHCAGTIGAEDNGIGLVGVAPHARLWSVKVLRANGNGDTASIIAGLDWVIARKQELGGNWIVSLSLGSDDSSDVEEQAFQRVADAGILAVAASGNSGGPVAFPAGYPTVMAVGAVDSKSQIADFSNTGAELSLVAPGVDVLSTLPRGTGSISYVATGAANFSGLALSGSSGGTISGKFVNCGFGVPSDFTSAVSGKIAVISRGQGITFHDKAQRAKDAGAIAVVIYNNDDSGLNFTLGNPPSDGGSWPIVIAITQQDGAALLQRAGETVTVANMADDYGFLSGTSMACPHVAGVAALVWSVDPNATAQQLRQALQQNAHDLGDSGFDTIYGFGLADALAAAKALNPAVFSNGSTPGGPTPTNGGLNGRRILRRGH